MAEAFDLAAVLTAPSPVSFPLPDRDCLTLFLFAICSRLDTKGCSASVFTGGNSGGWTLATSVATSSFFFGEFGGVFSFCGGFGGVSSGTSAFSSFGVSLTSVCSAISFVSAGFSGISCQSAMSLLFRFRYDLQKIQGRYRVSVS